MGEDIYTFFKEVKFCEDDQCLDCQGNYKDCTQCKNSDAYDLTPDPLTTLGYCKLKFIDDFPIPVSEVTPDSPFKVIEKKFVSATGLVKLRFNQAVNSLLNFNTVKVRVFKTDGLTEIATQFIKGEIKNAGKTISISVNLVDNVENGFLEVKFLNTNDVFEEGKPDNKVSQEAYVINDVSYYRGTNEAALVASAEAASTSIKVITIIYYLVSTSSALVLLKLFQMIDYLVFFNVETPRNLNIFIEFMGKSPIEDVPNFFKFLADNRCDEVKGKFSDEGITC